MTTKKQIASTNDIFIDVSETEHTVELGNGKCLKVWLREATWQNYTDAMRAFTRIDAKSQKISADFGAYYQEMLKKVLVKSEPKFDASDFPRLRADVGARIQELLVEPGDFTLSSDDTKN